MVPDSDSLSTAVLQVQTIMNRTHAPASQTTVTPSPVFVGGHHRSGTTLIRTMLNRHPRIACGPEGHLLDRTEFRAFHQYLEDTWAADLSRYGLGTDDLDRAIAAFIDDFFTRFTLTQGKQRWAEKTPKNILSIDYLFRLFPGAQFIHMIRDPRDVHCSVQSKALVSTPRWTGVTPEMTAESWVKRVTIGLQWRDHPCRYREVLYEDLVQNPELIMRSIIEFLGESWDARMIDVDGYDEGILPPNAQRPIFTSSIGRWRKDLPIDDVRRIEVIAGSAMKRIGYTVGQAP
ncbi:MAG: sulfotransferase [Chloroflexota bacterium]